MWSLLLWGIAHLQHLGCHALQEKLVWKCDKNYFWCQGYYSSPKRYGTMWNLTTFVAKVNGARFINPIAPCVLIDEEKRWSVQIILNLKTPTSIMCFHWKNRSKTMVILREWNHMTFMWWCKTFCHYACNI
jgi:hypothetical protein